MPSFRASIGASALVSFDFDLDDLEDLEVEVDAEAAVGLEVFEDFEDFEDFEADAVADAEGISRVSSFKLQVFSRLCNKTR